MRAESLSSPKNVDRWRLDYGTWSHRSDRQSVGDSRQDLDNDLLGMTFPRFPERFGCGDDVTTARGFDRRVCSALSAFPPPTSQTAGKRAP